jgi:hypothetical protein
MGPYMGFVGWLCCALGPSGLIRLFLVETPSRTNHNALLAPVTSGGALVGTDHSFIDTCQMRPPMS